MSMIATWKKQTRYREARVVDQTEGVTTLVVPASEWRSYADATSVATPPRVVLVEDVPAPPSAHYAVDAIAPDDTDAIASAVRITDTELAEVAAELSRQALARAVLAASLADIPGLEDPRLHDDDLPRLARAALVEGTLRASLDDPTRRMLAIEAELPSSAALAPSDRSATPAAALAATVLVALLRSGMRMARGPALRGPDETLPDPSDVSLLLREGIALRGIIPGRRLTFTLLAGEDALAIDSADLLSVRVRSGSEVVYESVGTQVRIPLSLLVPGSKLRLSPVSGDE